MVTFLRPVAAVLTALGLALALAGCGDDGPTRAEIADKIRSDPQMAGTPDRAVDCLADWYLEYASPEQREAFLAGRADGAPAGNPEAERAMVDCLKLAAGTP
ncbi:hypothetical protein AB0J86_18300 [Micromonospora sp. NPDC049559]|uniref:hypothetical protein n=1 Tax=Micromonospora sp. NPDC049559 TaxID=3155923 RepID=UPI00341C51E3